MKKLGLLILSCVFMFSCSTKSLITSTQNITNQKNKYNKVLVIGKTKDNTRRWSFEKQLVDALNKQDVNAVSSAEYGLEVLGTLDENQAKEIKKNLKKNGFDGVILTSLIDARKYKNVVEGRSGTVYYPTAHYGRFRRYYAYHPVTYWEADKLEDETEYTLESTLHKIDVDADNLQWIGRFVVDSKQGLNGVQEQYVTELTEALVKSSIQN